MVQDQEPRSSKNLDLRRAKVQSQNQKMREAGMPACRQSQPYSHTTTQTQPHSHRATQPHGQQQPAIASHSHTTTIYVRHACM